eukprot:Nitzschia sp. Nitz4//scaffold290_size23356//12132//13082//NITZ4_008490-RA/size23356-processed-gene-0.28-mRNA-1//-1//CDS//3329546099//9151//frame0
MTPDDDKLKILPIASGMPPWHALVFVGVLGMVGIAAFPSDLGKTAVLDTFTRRIFPEYISLHSLALIRLSIALSSWLLTFYMAFLAEGWDIGTTYKTDSKLRNIIYRLSGWKTLYPFTSWCWMMLGAKFSLSGYIALMASYEKASDIQPWVFRAAIVLWELSAPLALLVSAVVRYAIWPAVLATKRPHRLNSFRNQMQHNLNSVFSLSEMALLGGLPVNISHMSLAILVGVLYILFTWMNCYRYAKPEWGPQYLYWFMDPTRGKATTIALAALLVALVLSFVTFSAIEAVVDMTGSSLLGRLVCVIAVSSAVIKVS